MSGFSRVTLFYLALCSARRIRARKRIIGICRQICRLSYSLTPRPVGNTQPRDSSTLGLSLHLSCSNSGSSSCIVLCSSSGGSYPSKVVRDATMTSATVTQNSPLRTLTPVKVQFATKSSPHHRCNSNESFTLITRIICANPV